MTTTRPTYTSIIPVRDTVVFPKTTVTLSVGRPGSVEALHWAGENDLWILCVTQKDPSVAETPNGGELYEYGTLCRIKKMVGNSRFRSEEHTSELQSRENLVCRLLLETNGDLGHLHSFPTRRSSDLVTLSVGRPGSVEALHWAGENDLWILCVTQKDPSVAETPNGGELYEYGTLCRIKKMVGNSRF